MTIILIQRADWVDWGMMTIMAVVVVMGPELWEGVVGNILAGGQEEIWEIDEWTFGWGGGGFSWYGWGEVQGGTRNNFCLCVPLSILIALLQGCISWYIPRDGLMKKEWPNTASGWDVLGYTSPPTSRFPSTLEMGQFRVSGTVQSNTSLLLAMYGYNIPGITVFKGPCIYVETFSSPSGRRPSAVSALSTAYTVKSLPGAMLYIPVASSYYSISLFQH